MKKHQKIDVLINNAGITRDQLVPVMKLASWTEVIENNLSSLFKITQPVSRAMLRQRGGVIINISSVVATRPPKGQANYAAAKAGVEGFTRALAKDLGSKNIRVLGIAPGMIETDMSHSISQDMKDTWTDLTALGRFGQPEEIARTALFLASDDATYLTGTTLHVDGGM